MSYQKATLVDMIYLQQTLLIRWTFRRLWGGSKRHSR